MSRRALTGVLCAVAATVASLASAGCAATTVRSGLPPGNTAPGYEERWHPAFLFGVIPGTEPYDLGHICPAGWAQVTVTRDPFTLLSSVITLFVYSPSRVTIVCSAQGASGLPPYQGYAPTSDTSPAPHMPSPPEGD